MALGLLLTLDNLGIIEARGFLRYWPVLLIVGRARLAAEHRARAAASAGRCRDCSSSACSSYNLGLLQLQAALADPPARRRSQHGLEGPADGARAADTDADTSAALDAFAHAGRRRAAGTNTQDFRGGSASAVMGGCEIDLRKASIERRDGRVRHSSRMMGGVEIRVPEDWAVENRGLALLGGFEDKLAAAHRCARSWSHRLRDHGGRRGQELRPDAPDPGGLAPRLLTYAHGLGAAGAAPRRLLVVAGGVLLGGGPRPDRAPFRPLRLRVPRRLLGLPAAPLRRRRSLRVAGTQLAAGALSASLLLARRARAWAGLLDATGVFPASLARHGIAAAPVALRAWGSCSTCSSAALHYLLVAFEDSRRAEAEALQLPDPLARGRAARPARPDPSALPVQRPQLDQRPRGSAPRGGAAGLHPARRTSCAGA